MVNMFEVWKRIYPFSRADRTDSSNVAADVRRRIAMGNLVPPPHVGSYGLFLACLYRPWILGGRLPSLWAVLLVLLARPANAAEQNAAELRLGYFPNITHAQALYARATGEFERQTGARI